MSKPYSQQAGQTLAWPRNGVSGLPQAEVAGQDGTSIQHQACSTCRVSVLKVPGGLMRGTGLHFPKPGLASYLFLPPPKVGCFR